LLKFFNFIKFYIFIRKLVIFFDNFIAKIKKIEEEIKCLLDYFNLNNYLYKKLKFVFYFLEKVIKKFFNSYKISIFYILKALKKIKKL